MRPISYAKALREVVSTQKHDDDTLVRRLMHLLNENGHMHMLPEIIRSYVSLGERENRTNRVVITSAERLSPPDIQSALSDIGARADEHPELRTDATLTGGYVAQKGSVRVDRSYKRQLSELYHLVAGT